MSEEGRIISPHRPKSDDFPPNEVRTSRYTLITFLPKCLFEQFRRLANVYFVVLGIIAAVGYYGGYYEAAVEPAAILAPVSIVVMISVIKEGVEDIKRHQADTKVNARPVKVVGVDGTVTSQQWKDLLVGSIVLLQSDEEIPADIVVLAAGGIQGNTAYVETAAIDGETNLKVRAPGLMKDTAATATGVGMSTSPLHTPSPKATTKPSDPYDKSITVSEDRSRVLGVTDLNISLSVEAPNSSIHHFDGSMEFTDDQKVNHRATLTEKNILLRGAVVRATGWCVGIVAYTGKHTKLSLNSRNPPSKLSAVDRVVNKSLAVAIGVMIVVCFISMLFRYE